MKFSERFRRFGWARALDLRGRKLWYQVSLNGLWISVRLHVLACHQTVSWSVLLQRADAISARELRLRSHFHRRVCFVRMLSDHSSLPPLHSSLQTSLLSNPSPKCNLSLFLCAFDGVLLPFFFPRLPRSVRKVLYVERGGGPNR